MISPLWERYVRKVCHVVVCVVIKVKDKKTAQTGIIPGSAAFNDYPIVPSIPILKSIP